MEIFAFIPARYGSTRFPGKPLAPILGKPMIEHVYKSAIECGDLTEVLVVTDDPRIIDCVKAFGGKAVMTSPDHASGTDRIAEAAETLGLNNDDLVINIQGDQPRFDPATITRMITPLKEDKSIPMSTLKFRIRDRNEIENPNIVKVVTDRDDFALFFSRYPIPFIRDRDTTDIEHYKHPGFYAYRKSFLIEFSRLPQGELEKAEKLEQLRALEHGFKIKVPETFSDSIEIDTPEDIPKIEAVLSGSGGID
jgi:3-deoxy-manno-octulosonate cytidylyltransferase (CMP-KDO synthetase)